MRYPVRIFCITLVLLLLTSSSLFGAGFAVYNFSARGNALGGALIGRADDPSAIALNPAGITQIPGSAFMTTAGFLMPRGTLVATGTAITAD